MCVIIARTIDRSIAPPACEEVFPTQTDKTASLRFKALLALASGVGERLVTRKFGHPHVCDAGVTQNPPSLPKLPSLTVRTD